MIRSTVAPTMTWSSSSISTGSGALPAASLASVSAAAALPASSHTKGCALRVRKSRSRW
jgi:hypothetical protein